MEGNCGRGGLGLIRLPHLQADPQTRDIVVAMHGRRICMEEITGSNTFHSLAFYRPAFASQHDCNCMPCRISSFAGYSYRPVQNYIS